MKDEIKDAERLLSKHNKSIIKEIENNRIPKGFIGIDEMVANCWKEKGRTTCKGCKDECLI